jgi:drug/metabolite transporter (DMT)-like permease
MDKIKAERQRRLGQLLVVTAAIAWSSAGFFTRLIAADSWTMGFWRGIFGGVFIAAFFIWQQRWDALRAVKAMGRPGWLLTLCGIVCLVTFIPALKLTSVANVAVIYATTPFVAAVLAWIWFRERASTGTMLASLLALVGVAITVGGGEWKGGGDLLGDLLALIMTLSMAIYIVACRRYRNQSMLPTVVMSNLLSAVVSLPFAAPLTVSHLDLVYLALFGLCQMALGATAFTIGSRLLPAAQSALIGALETPLAPFWVWLAFAEVPAAGTVIGGAIVMMAVLSHIAFESLGLRIWNIVGKPRTAKTS